MFRSFLRFTSTKRFLVTSLGLGSMAAAEPVEISGIYPHLAYFNNEGECGTGVVVPWADRLWVATYGPHLPKGSTDKLYEITPDLKEIIRPESIGGTPANRMIHKESGQLFIASHVIDAKGGVRTIPFSSMFGRMTGNARHLSDPANKIVYATMEEGIYEVDVHTLAVKEVWQDEQLKGGRHADLPGYHGKGFYSAQGRYVYANNGDHASVALSDPTVPSGVLAEWDGKADHWTVVRRNQFTEVTGPGGITGNADTAHDPLWSIGWDYRSLILMCLSEGKWHTYRLPKGSHSYDGAHGWNTEWPRIREVGEKDFLMTMHGTFWKFPPTFTPAHATGIRPRSNYLKVIGDFCRWNDRLVMGCDDTAKSEFLNKSRYKGEIAAPQSQSNLWFVQPSQLDHFGPVIGRGAVWQNDAVKAGVPSDPYLFAGYDERCLNLSHNSKSWVEFALEVDLLGDGSWSPLAKVSVPDGKMISLPLPSTMKGEWVRVKSSTDCTKASAVFSYRSEDPRSNEAAPVFAGLALPGDSKAVGGIVRSRAGGKRDLVYAATDASGNAIGAYLLNEKLELVRQSDPAVSDEARKSAAIPDLVYQTDAASVIFTDDGGKRWRLPKGDASFDTGGTFGRARIVREVATERNLLNAHGNFYELPASNAGGFSRIRPVATHNRMIQDFCSYRGLFVASGTAADLPAENPHIIRSDDGKAALWVGAIDDIWQLGKPHGKGGPWKDSTVKACEVSDPYLMTAYDRKSLTLSADRPTTITAEIDITGAGDWCKYDSYPLHPGEPLQHVFPQEFSAYWIRFTADQDCKATALLDYQ